MRSESISLAVAAFLLAAGDAHAQAVSAPAVPPNAAAVPPSVSPVPGIVPQQQPVIKPPANLPEEALPAYSEAGEPVRLVSVDIQGATVYPAAQVKAGFAGLQNGTTTRGQILNAVRALQLQYRNDGYFLTKVSASFDTQPQGTALKIRVIEGYVADVKIAGEVGPVATLVYNYLKNLEAIRPIRLADLERYVLLAQAVPGISVRTSLRAVKDEAGAVELVAQVERKAYNAFLSDDNRGPRTAGPNELLAGVQANSFTSLGERSQILLYNTPFDNEELFGQASFDALVGDEGLKLNAYVGYGELVPGDILRPAQYKSRLFLTGIGAVYPLIRSRDMSVYLNGNFDISQTVVDLNDFTPTADHRASKNNLRIFRAGARMEAQDTLLGTDFAAANSVDFKISQGFPGLFDGTKDGDARPSRPKEKNDFTKINLEVHRTQSLYTWPNSSLAIYLAGAGQWTGDVLPPSEKFFLGGVAYGRGFYYGEVTGDRAIAGTIELQFNDPYDITIFGYDGHIGLQYYGFYDVGQTWEQARGDLNRHIESAGIGIRASITEYLSIQLEGVERFTRRPISTNVSLESARAVFFKISAQY